MADARPDPLFCFTNGSHGAPGKTFEETGSISPNKELKNAETEGQEIQSKFLEYKKRWVNLIKNWYEIKYLQIDNRNFL